MSLLALFLAIFRPAAPVPEPPAPIPIPVDPSAPPLSAIDRDVLIRTVFGEARDQSEQGQVAVVHVVRNRALARGTTAAVECQRPWQFSCWNAGDPNLPRMQAMRPDVAPYPALAAVVDRAWSAPDITGGARHYYAPRGMPNGPPKWALHPKARLTASIGHHLFFADVP